MKGFKYLGCSEGDFPISESLSQSIISLPMHPYLSEQDINCVLEVIRSK